MWKEMSSVIKWNIYNEDEEFISCFNWYDYVWFGYYLWFYLWWLCFVLIIILIGNIVIILGFYLMKIVIDIVIFNCNFLLIWVLSGIFLISLVIVFLCFWYCIWVIIEIG